MKPAIRIDNISKQYRLGDRPVGTYVDLRDVLANAATASLRRFIGRNGRAQPKSADTFWALKDVSLEVQPGEVVGIIGRNGAGKSTLLKILSRITEPTTGRVELRGRIASLLEVGTGFHPDLTGRENIYLNGSLLGMRHREIARKFDEIVAFSEIEAFLDTPVKRYSSGMYVRLAFAVAAHLEPEIVLVDEVLAVGDAGFQRKCLGKMGEVARSGRTVLFVSHNMAAVRNLCTRGLVLSRGVPTCDGPIDEAVEHYMGCGEPPKPSWPLDAVAQRTGSQVAQFTELRFEDDDGNPVSEIPMGASLNIVLRFRAKESVSGLAFGIVFADMVGQRLFRVQSNEALGGELPPSRAGGEVRCRLPRVPLVPGVYRVTVGVGRREVDALDHLPDVASFAVLEADVFGTGKSPTSHGGSFFVESDWKFDYR
jgi:lipopolysaccharide transport system ATP-binding protein